jgi:aryl-alcohol dehydrogenase-like predicted oxidoreductase
MKKKRIIIWCRQRINPSDVNTQMAAQSLKKYVDNWFTHFDTADHYADGEEILGIVKQQYGDGITIGTKRCPDPEPLQDWEVEQAVITSLQRLKISHIDLMQFHDRNPNQPYGIERLHILNKLKQKWLIKNIWLTNANTQYIQKVIKEGIPIASNQVCYSLLAYRPDSDMFKVCEENRIEILGFWTVAGWFFSEKRLHQPEPDIDTLSNASLKKYKRFIDVRGWRELYQNVLNALNNIAKNHWVSIATVASNFILQQKSVWWVIIGARLGESEHIQENKKILSLQLSEQEKHIIHNSIIQWNPLPWDFGDEYRLDHSEQNGWHESLTSTGKSGYKWHQNNYIK